MDDDETPDPAWLTTYEAAMLEHQPDALGGRIDVFFEDGERPRWLQDELLGFLGKLDHGAPRWLTERSTPIFGGNFAFRRSVFERIGNFDPQLGRQGAVNIGGEDTEIFRRLLDAGCRVRWVPDAVIQHRIQTPKLRRSYFLDLHFRQGRTEGVRKRGAASRIPPKYHVAAARARVGSRHRPAVSAGRGPLAPVGDERCLFRRFPVGLDAGSGMIRLVSRIDGPSAATTVAHTARRNRTTCV